MIEDQEVVSSINPNKAPRSWAVGQTIDRINNAMKAMNHRLYRGDVYIKHESSVHTFLRFADVDGNLNKPTANASLREEILSNMTSLSKILKHQDCQVIKQLLFDFDLIEVSEPKGNCFSISRRAFVDYPSEAYGANQRPPCAFLEFNSEATEIDAGYSKEASRTLSPISTHALHSSTSFTNAFALEKCRKNVGNWLSKGQGFGQDNMGQCISGHNFTTICCFHYLGETVQRFNAKRRHADCSVR